MAAEATNVDKVAAVLGDYDVAGTNGVGENQKRYHPLCCIYCFPGRGKTTAQGYIYQSLVKNKGPFFQNMKKKKMVITNVMMKFENISNV